MHERIHVVVPEVLNRYSDKSPAYFADWLRQDFPGIEVARRSNAASCSPTYEAPPASLRA